jgi:hypothetical protein
MAGVATVVAAAPWAREATGGPATSNATPMAVPANKVCLIVI